VQAADLLRVGDRQQIKNLESKKCFLLQKQIGFLTGFSGLALIEISETIPRFRV
jgi:hypothetical protein